MAAANAPKSSKLGVSTHVGRKEDEVYTLVMTIEDIKNEIRSAKPAEAILGEILMCGDMDFGLTVYLNGGGADQVGNISYWVLANKWNSLGKREWKSVELFAGENSTGAFLKTSTPQILSMGNFNYSDPQLLSHDIVLADENSSYFPNGVLTIKAIVKIQGEKIVTHTKLPGKSITAAQLKGELSEHFRKMLKSQQFSDFRVICQGEIIPCHQNILAARSDVFEAMFDHNMMESKAGEVVIKDFDLKTVKALLTHIYTGEVEYKKEDTAQLIKAADKYQLHGLKQKIEDDLVNDVKIQNAIDMFVLGDEVHAKKLRNVSKEVIVRNAVAIVKIAGWKEALGRFQDLTLEIFESVVNSKDHNNAGSI